MLSTIFLAVGGIAMLTGMMLPPARKSAMWLMIAGVVLVLIGGIIHFGAGGGLPFSPEVHFAVHIVSILWMVSMWWFGGSKWWVGAATVFFIIGLPRTVEMVMRIF